MKILWFSAVSFHKEHYRIHQVLRSSDSELHFQQRAPVLASHAHVKLACLMYLVKQLPKATKDLESSFFRRWL